MNNKFYKSYHKIKFHCTCRWRNGFYGKKMIVYANEFINHENKKILKPYMFEFVDMKINRKGKFQTYKVLTTSKHIQMMKGRI